MSKEGYANRRKSLLFCDGTDEHDNLALPCRKGKCHCSADGPNIHIIYVSLHYQSNIILLSTFGNRCRQLIKAKLPMSLGVNRFNRSDKTPVQFVRVRRLPYCFFFQMDF